MTDKIILASASPFRKSLLQGAGLSFVAEAAEIDERAVEDTLGTTDPEDIAAILAEAKAQDVSARHPGSIVIGSDQTLALEGVIFHKPKDMEEARHRLLKLSGKTHQLNSAVVLARDGETVWRHVAVAHMTMRTLEPGFVGRHLASVGDRILSSVGAYQYEGEGIQLFEEIQGDYFTIIGLPMLPLLAKLRNLAVIDG